MTLSNYLKNYFFVVICIMIGMNFFAYLFNKMFSSKKDEKSIYTREKVEELRLSLQIQANKDFLKFFVTKTKVIVTKNNIDIKQLKLFENYRENRV